MGLLLNIQWVKCNHNRLVGVEIIKTNKLKRKTFVGQVQRWYVLIYIYIYITLRPIQIFKFLVTKWFFSLFSDDPICNGILLLLYSLPFFHLSLSRVNQIANLLIDTCPISTFLKSLWIVVRLEVTV